MLSEIKIGKRVVGSSHPPLVIAEIGINHGGDVNKAIQMVEDAAKSGCECIKIQTHILEDEMIPNNVIPGNSNERIWDIIERCSLTEKEELMIKQVTENNNMIFLSTPFSKASVDRLNRIGVPAFKIGSGECSNYPLIKYIAKHGLPVILSTGMNNIASISKAVQIFEEKKLDYALLHCTSIYPTPYNLVRLGVLNEYKNYFPKAIIGLSDHSDSIYPCLGAVALGASIIEKHFTSSKKWQGPDINISIDPESLKKLIEGSRIIHESMGGTKSILEEEMHTIKFAYASVVALKNINSGDEFTEENIWVKRPGTGEVSAMEYDKILGKKSRNDIKKNEQIKWVDIYG